MIGFKTGLRRVFQHETEDTFVKLIEDSLISA